MALKPGTRLGPYQITAPLGVGGMGEVYKATDTRLGRTVAINRACDAHEPWIGYLLTFFPTLDNSARTRVSRR